MSNVADLAVQISKRFPVFPCGPDKAPRVAGGFKAASQDPDVIRAWDWPEDSLVGAAVTDNLLVIDIDPRNGGRESEDALRATGMRFETGLRSKTAGGGTHYFFSLLHEEVDAKFRAQLAPGIDVKAPGKGYVIVPPSAGYMWAEFGAPSRAPQWLLDEITMSAAEALKHEPSPPKYPQNGYGTAYGIRKLDETIRELREKPEGGRNHALNASAFWLARLSAGGELDWEYAEHLLWEAARFIGLRKGEIEATIASGYSAGVEHPWQEQKDDYWFLNALRTPLPEEAMWLDWEGDDPLFPYYRYPLLPKHAYVLVYGGTEAAKSMTMIGLLAQASHEGIKCTVYSLENPPQVDRKRVRRFAPLKENFRITQSYIDLYDTRQVDELIEREKAWNTDIILIDTYSHAFYPKNQDGNANAIDFAKIVRLIMREVGCTVVVVDHTGFTDSGEPRSASAKRQQVDVAILMEKLPAAWRPGQPYNVTMTNRKSSRYGNPFDYEVTISDERSDPDDRGGLSMTMYPLGPTNVDLKPWGEASA